VVRHVSTAGTVWINSTALPSGSSLYEGDTLATAENGFALITSAEQGRVEVRQDSLVSIGPREIILNGGVVGSAGLPVRLGDYSIRPARMPQPHSWFVVAKRRGQVLVAAHEGSIVITRNGAVPVLVPSGSYAVPSIPPSTSNPVPDGNDPTGDKTAGDAPDSNHDEGWTIGPLSHAASVALVFSLGAGALAGTIVGLALTEKSVSPSQ
jgi:hypothetical protein